MQSNRRYAFIREFKFIWPLSSPGTGLKNKSAWLGFSSVQFFFFIFFCLSVTKYSFKNKVPTLSFWLNWLIGPPRCDIGPNVAAGKVKLWFDPLIPAGAAKLTSNTRRCGIRTVCACLNRTWRRSSPQKMETPVCGWTQEAVWGISPRLLWHCVSSCLLPELSWEERTSFWYVIYSKTLDYEWIKALNSRFWSTNLRYRHNLIKKTELCPWLYMKTTLP